MLIGLVAAVTVAATGVLAVRAMPEMGALAAVRARLTATVGTGYWHTSGNRIIDSAGNPVRIAGVNWYGFETPDEVAHGLWAQDYHTVVNDIAALGYNTIRIPFSNQMIETPIVPQNLSFFNNSGPINTDLKGLTSIQILQKIIAYAGQVGLKVILDDHRSEAGESAEQNGLWYTSAYPASAWTNDWVTLAKMFAGNPTVVGFDLRNEPHTPTGDTYAQGATWGSGDPNTDVRLAYEQAGDAILGADPGALVFCEGVSENPDASASGGFDSTWWGGDLAEAGQFPVVLNTAGHVVYSAHDYGPNLFQQAWFNSSTTSASLDAVWNKNWGYLYAQGTAPVWVGEFGTDNTASDISSSTPGSQGQWFSSLVAFLSANPWMGWTYWALNGEDSFALLDNNYDATPVSSAKQSLLATIQFPLPGASTGSPSPSPSGSAACQVAYSLTGSWTGGFQAQIVLTDTGTAPISPWTLTFAFGGGEKINNLWNATYAQSGPNVTVTAASFDATISPGSSVTVGFTANDTANPTTPTGFAVNGTACTT